MRYTLDDLLARTEQVGDCRLWTGATAGSGYPVARDARERYVHRLVLRLDGRPLGVGEQARHLCGQTRCIWPGHLVAGDQAANEADKVALGRDRRGCPGVTHCGRYLDDGTRCRREPHSGLCKPEIFDAIDELVEEPAP